jgi:hypothetical protein
MLTCEEHTQHASDNFPTAAREHHARVINTVHRDFGANVETSIGVQQFAVVPDNRLSWSH